MISFAAMQETSDLYGFTVKLSELQVAERAECDRVADAQQGAWMQCIEQDKLPGEAKLKEMIRKVRSRSLCPRVKGTRNTANGAAKKVEAGGVLS